MAARVDPAHASARHQALHHFFVKAEWSHEEMLRRVCQWVILKMDFARGGWRIIDDTGFPKKGRHPVGVAPVLRHAGQARQLPSSGEHLAGKQPRKLAGRLAALPARRLGGRQKWPRKSEQRDKWKLRA